MNHRPVEKVEEFVAFKFLKYKLIPDIVSAYVLHEDSLTLGWCTIAFARCGLTSSFTNSWFNFCIFQWLKVITIVSGNFFKKAVSDTKAQFPCFNTEHLIAFYSYCVGGNWKSSSMREKLADRRCKSWGNKLWS